MSCVAGPCVEVWQVARRQLQLSAQHPAFILRRMQTVSRDVTSTDINDMEKTLNAVPIDVLHALLDGVSKKKVHKAGVLQVEPPRLSLLA